MTVLTRYLLRAHIGPFLFAFVALTGVILVNTLAKELANLAGKGLPMDVVFEFFVLSLPANIALTLPMAVLVAVLYTFSTMAAENEITALRASGIDLRRAALPLILAAGFIAGGMIWFNDQVLPASNYRWRLLMTDVAQARPLLALREQTLNPIRTSDGQTPYYLEAHSLDSGTGTMRKISIYDVSNGVVMRTIQADSGFMAFNASHTDLLLTLYDGDVREVDFGDPAAFQVVAFERQVMRMRGVSDRLERSSESNYRTDRDMTVAMMRSRVDTLRADLERIRTTEPVSAAAAGGDASLLTAERERLRAWRDRELSPDGTILPLDDGAPALDANPAEEQPAAAAVTESARYNESRIRNLEFQIREYQVEIQKKYSIASATLVFVLIGIPLALRFPRGGIGMVIAVSLAIFGIYYVGLIGGETLGDEGYVEPVLAMWATNALFGVLGLFGFLKLGREKGTTRGGGWGELPGWIRRGRARRSAGR